MDTSSRVVRAIDGVLEEIDRAGASGWKRADGSCHQVQLESVRADVIGLREETLREGRLHFELRLTGSPPIRHPAYPERQ